MIPIWVVPAAKVLGAGVAIYLAYQFVDNNWATDAGIKKGIERQAVETAKVKAAYVAFVEAQRVLGEKQTALAAAINATNQKEKEKKDAQLESARAAASLLASELRSAREERARSGYLPGPSADAKNPDRATLIRSKFERAMGYLDERGQGIAKAGDDYRVGLDSLKPK